MGGNNLSTRDYLQFITEQFVTYLDMPADEKRRRKEAKKRSKWSSTNKWFGTLPLALRIMRQQSNKQAK